MHFVRVETVRALTYSTNMDAAIAAANFVYRDDMEVRNLLSATDNEPNKEPNEQKSGSAFVVSQRPLVPKELLEQRSQNSAHTRDYENLGELPRFYGRPVFFGIARDPRTLFVYWEIDWKRAFGDKPPVDRKVYLRVMSNDGSEETRMAVEPFAGNQCVTVSHACSIYRVELGYHEPAEVWHSVAVSEAIATPPDDVSESGNIDVATVPFHLSFQHMVDTFRGSKYDGDALVEIVAQLQKRADDPSQEPLSEADREILRALESTLSEADAQQRAKLRKAEDPFATRERIEAILGFGASSRM